MDIPSLSEPADVARYVATRTGLNDVVVRCLCSSQQGARMTCVMEAAKDAAPGLAAALGGYVFGYSTVVFSVALPDGFRCAERDRSVLAAAGRCDCRVSHPQAPD